jgi:hypothetical protein
MSGNVITDIPNAYSSNGSAENYHWEWLPNADISCRQLISILKFLSSSDVLHSRLGIYWIIYVDYRFLDE